MRISALRIFIVLSILLNELPSCLKVKAVTKEIGLIEKACDKKGNCDTCCNCTKSIFNVDENISLIQYKSGYEFADSLSYCFSTALQIYKHLLPLDSIYYQAIASKSVVYWPGFVEGSYTSGSDTILLDLTFINLAANTSRSTAHKYLISYNKKDQTISKPILEFSND